MGNKERLYNPLRDPTYMSNQMKKFFQNLLLDELQQLLDEDYACSSVDFEDIHHQADPIDQGTTENLRSIHHAFHEHEKLLSHQVKHALQRLACGTYGYCIVTGKPIGVERLLVAPHTAYCLDAQEEQEENKQGHL